MSEKYRENFVYMLGRCRCSKQSAINTKLSNFIEHTDFLVAHLVNISECLHAQPTEKEGKRASKAGRKSVINRLLVQLRLAISNILMSIYALSLSLFQTE